MLILGSTATVVRVITGSAANVTTSVSYIDYNGTVVTPGPSGNPAAITTAATTTVVAAPAASTNRNVKELTFRNTHASVSTTFEVQKFDGTTGASLWAGTLVAGESVVFDQSGDWQVYDSSGRLKTVSVQQVFSKTNQSTATVSAGYAADTYLAGSAILMPSNGPIAGTQYRCEFDMVKTAAGTAAFTVNVRFGTAGTTADASILSLAFAVGTAAVDTGRFRLGVGFRSVGAGTSAVIVGSIECSHSLAATGLVTTGASGFGQITTVSAGFNSTTANAILGISVNGGASFSGTNATVTTQALSLTN